MPNTKPRLFIGSSKESLMIAHAIQANLIDIAEVTAWDQSSAELTTSTLSNLITQVRISDFGVFVFAPDDVISIRGTTNTTARDNVILELGIFLGALGPERTFYFVPRGDSSLHLPSDLLGIAAVEYEVGRSDNLWRAAVAPGCIQVRERIGKVQKSLQMSPLAGKENVHDQILLPEENQAHSTSDGEGEDLQIVEHPNGYKCTGNLKSYKAAFRRVNGQWKSDDGEYVLINSPLLPELLHLLPAANCQFKRPATHFSESLEQQALAAISKLADAQQRFSRDAAQLKLRSLKYQNDFIENLMGVFSAKSWIAKANNRGDFKLTPKALQYLGEAQSW